jgi:GAF domain-containing protein
MNAPLRPDEDARLEDLKQYRILDTLPERDYDDLTRLATRILDAPISLMTFVTRDRQWFKARCGTEVEGSSRDQSFCAWAILRPTEVMVVEDASTDPRFEDNGFVTRAPFIRFYAGAPMVNRAGRPLGTLCVLDVRPRTLAAEDREALQTLARQATNLLELRRSVIELEHERDRLRETNDDLARARRQLSQLLDKVEGSGGPDEYFEPASPPREED